jgi:hypothetical protein
MSTVTGVFEDRASAEQAIDQIEDRGVSRDAVGALWKERLVREPEEITVVGYKPHHDTAGSEAAKGAAGGAIGGAATGAGTILLASAGVALLPGIGAVLAAGTAAAAAAAAAAGGVGGAVTGGLIGALIGATDDDASKVSGIRRQLHSAIEREGVVVSIDTLQTDLSLTETAEILESTGAEDVRLLSDRASEVIS